MWGIFLLTVQNGVETSGKEKNETAADVRRGKKEESQTRRENQEKPTISGKGYLNTSKLENVRYYRLSERNPTYYCCPRVIIFTACKGPLSLTCPVQHQSFPELWRKPLSGFKTNRMWNFIFLSVFLTYECQLLVHLSHYWQHAIKCY